MCEPRKNENFSPGRCSKELELPGIVALQRLRLEDCHEFEFSYSAVLPVINTTKQAEAGGTSLGSPPSTPTSLRETVT